MTEVITSVGIDIGTSTTSIVFSHIFVENTSGFAKVPNYRIVDKAVIYRSSIYFTPLVSNTKLDIDKILEIVTKEYKLAGIKPEEVDTGAVIITGDTARKENAEEVLRGIAKYAGDFVVATAGPELESIIAGKGSGADQLSRANFTTVANFDLGGGTTNISVFKDGATQDVACFDIGGRLIRFSPGTLTIEYAFRKLTELGKELGFPIEVGVTLTVKQVEEICDHMGEAIYDILTQKTTSDKYKFYQTQDSRFVGNPEIAQVTFSGGVGDLIYNENPVDDFAFNDIGILLAKAIKKQAERTSVKILKPSETIGATVVGAGTHTTEVSGSTITITNSKILPLQNIPVLKIEVDEEKYLEETVKRKLNWLVAGEDSEHVALAMDGPKNISFAETQILAKEIVQAMKPIIDRTNILIVILYNDFAKVLGQTINSQLGNNVDLLIVDGISTAEGDYIDLGKPLGMGSVLPVIVKTIVFNY